MHFGRQRTDLHDDLLGRKPGQELSQTAGVGVEAAQLFLTVTPTKREHRLALPEINRENSAPAS